MQDERQRLKEHIQSARDWLGRAEHSLNREKDIEGDLSVMLAQAELQRAREAERQGAKRGLARVGKYLPLVLAVFLAAVYLFYSRLGVEETDAEQMRFTRQMKPVSERKEKKREILPEVSDSAESEMSRASLSANERFSSERMEEQPPNEPRVLEAGVKEEFKLPTEEMQKLMNSASKKLRAE